VAGKPVLLWTAERIRQQAPEYPLYFAVDGPELKTLLQANGFEAIETAAELPSGTDRIAAANRIIGAARIINVQGDEPLVQGSHIRMLDQLLCEGVDMATVGVPLDSNEAYQDPNTVKLVRAANGHALYFSRAPIPYIRDSAGQFDPAQTSPGDVLIHVGLYAYTAQFLEVFAALPAGKLEQLEKLEMLRALENGYTIATGTIAERTIGIDTPDNAAAFSAVVAKGLSS
jgi:3-deoxy-manno-octulosonate cytidylyltransferase (CMP-KDO synthetase)